MKRHPTDRLLWALLVVIIAAACCLVEKLVLKFGFIDGVRHWARTGFPSAIYVASLLMLIVLVALAVIAPVAWTMQWVLVRLGIRLSNRPDTSQAPDYHDSPMAH